MRDASMAGSLAGRNPAAEVVRAAFIAYAGRAMKTLTALVIALALAVSVPTSGAAEKLLVYFSPKGGCAEAVVEALNRSKSTVLVQAYSFTSKPIAEALIAAAKRGVKIQAILDKSQRTERYTEATFLLHAGIPTYIDAVHAIAHNKVIVIDDQVVITGSFNFTTAAEEHNAENLLVIQDAAIAAQYTKNWNLHLSHSEVYVGPTEKTVAATKRNRRY